MQGAVQNLGYRCGGVPFLDKGLSNSKTSESLLSVP